MSAMKAVRISAAASPHSGVRRKAKRGGVRGGSATKAASDARARMRGVIEGVESHQFLCEQRRVGERSGVHACLIESA